MCRDVCIGVVVGKSYRLIANLRDWAKVLSGDRVIGTENLEIVLDDLVKDPSTLSLT